MTMLINSQKLRIIINERDWDQLLENVKPKYFVKQESKPLPNATILAQICQLLVSKATPDVVKILCLKCLGNSCLDGYKYKQHTSENISFKTYHNKYSKDFYNELAENNLYKHGKNCDCLSNSYFPYGGVIEWVVDYIKTYSKSMDCLKANELDIFRLSIQFLCNLFTYACDVMSKDNVLQYLNCDNLKHAILNSIQSDHRFLTSAACIYVHNALKELHHDYFKNHEKDLYLKLLKPVKEGFASAKDTLLYLLHRSNMFEDIYNNITMNEKIDLLEIIYNELWKSWQSGLNAVLMDDQIEFLALIFCKRSDLILKTVNTYVYSIDPIEVILILNILGLVTTQYRILKNSRSLLINCKYLLMSLHMIGKEADNYFTPITNLSKIAHNVQRKATNINSNDIEISETLTKCDPQKHPAYGFKAGLIQVIANMVYKDRMCQDLFREIDGIPLLLDCCNIDARNPFILQWTIFALRNLCEKNPENQEIIRNCKRESILDSPMLQEIGLTLHEDADEKPIRIVPLYCD